MARPEEIEKELCTNALAASTGSASIIAVTIRNESNNQ